MTNEAQIPEITNLCCDCRYLIKNTILGLIVTCKSFDYRCKTKINALALEEMGLVGRKVIPLDYASCTRVRQDATCDKFEAKK